jgi:hypothetical protein
MYFVFSTYKEVLLLFCDISEFGVAESPVEVEAEADPRKLPVPEISCQLKNNAEYNSMYQECHCGTRSSDSHSHIIIQYAEKFLLKV